jgi:glycosyltransferase involved in cell wall biosynthesis
LSAGRRLKVGLNLISVAEGGGGIARYAFELATALARRDDVELHLFVGLDASEMVRGADWLDCVRVTRMPVRVTGPPLHLAAQFGALPALAVARRLDVVHSPANAGPVLLPGVRSVITMHDTIWLRAADQWGTAAAVRTMHRVAVPTTRRADRVLTDSHDAARDLREQLGIRAERLDVAHLGVRVDPDAPATPESELRERLDLGANPVVLCVAQKRPYKNQEVLVRALSDERLAHARLVLPGAAAPYEQYLRALAADLGVADRMQLPAWLDDEDLEGLFRLATCVALPSRLEGFGLPVLEAMARGVPVACSDRSALPEIAGDAALLFDPDDERAVADALAQLLLDEPLRRDFVVRGRERAAMFTWEATAEATVASYRRAAAQRRRTVRFGAA